MHCESQCNSWLFCFLLMRPGKQRLRVQTPGLLPPSWETQVELVFGLQQTACGSGPAGGGSFWGSLSVDDDSEVCNGKQCTQPSMWKSCLCASCPDSPLGSFFSILFIFNSDA